MTTEELFRAVNKRLVDAGRPALAKDDFLVIISALQLSGEVVIEDGQIWSPQERHKHIKEQLSKPECSNEG